jgi:predicted regulator of Ras-like GTPase activity (Roadblock/LC7/MglB family)
MDPLKSTLSGLSDVDGVIGSFVIADTGALVASNLPSVFDDRVFADAGPRIVRFVEATAALAGGLRVCVMRFSEHKLFLRPVEGAFLGVVLTSAASVPALKVAANIVSRRLAGALASAQQTAAERETTGPSTHRTLASSPAPPVAPPAAAPSVPPAAPKPQRFYRGRPVG